MPTTKKSTALQTTKTQKNARQSVTQFPAPRRAATPPIVPQVALKANSRVGKATTASAPRKADAAPQTPQPSLFAEPPVPTHKPEQKTTKTAAKTPKATLKTVAKPAIVAPPAVKTAKKGSAKTSSQPQTKAEAKSAAPSKIALQIPKLAPPEISPSAEGTAALKATRKRAPADLATQYGENTERKPRKAVEETKKKRPRRDAVLRQKMRDIIEPGDELVARLRRAGMIAGSVPEDSETRVRRAKSPARQAQGWEARCGKCGGKSTFLTQAGLCPRCGAIMVREAV